jgi:hypothetical protein
MVEALLRPAPTRRACVAGRARTPVHHPTHQAVTTGDAITALAQSRTRCDASFRTACPVALRQLRARNKRRESEHSKGAQHNASLIGAGAAFAHRIAMVRVTFSSSRASRPVPHSRCVRAAAPGTPSTA